MLQIELSWICSLSRLKRKGVFFSSVTNLILMMNVPPVIQKKASEYVATFEPSLYVEGVMIKEQVRNEIKKAIDELSHEQRSVFDQSVLDGLQKLREGVKDDAADQIDLKIQSLQNSIRNADHQSSSVGALPKYPVKEKMSLEEKQQIARSYLAFLGGVNPQKEVIMSQHEYSRLLEYTDHLIEYGEVRNDIKRIKPIAISKKHITYTYYLIHKELYGSKPLREVFIHFLRAVFLDFESTPAFDTIKAKFGDAPKSYESDVKKSKS